MPPVPPPPKSPKLLSDELFGWQGFHFPHPVDWGLDAVQGKHASGYARLTASTGLALQIRWEQAGKATPESFVREYLRRLHKDASRTKQPFSSSMDSSPEGVSFRWSGGRGECFVKGDRCFVLEVSGPGKRHLGILREIQSSFQVSSDRPLWAVFGLRVRLPAALPLVRSEFSAGRTELHWGDLRTKIHATRLALAGTLLQNTALETIAREAGLRGIVPFEAAEGMAENGLVRHDSQRNQIVILKVGGIRPQWKSSWDWLA